MNEPNWQSPPPRTILVATDLTPRCDRALDRAILLARQWQARLVALTVIEPAAALPAQADSHALRRALERRMRTELAGAGVETTVRVEEGAVINAILHAAAEERCDLIVTGVAHLAPFSRVVLGTAVDALLRRSPLPLLVVRNRARAPYSHVSVACDFSDSSRRALATAASFFPNGALSVFHAFEVPYSSLPGLDTEQAKAAARAAATRDGEAFLDEAGLPAHVRHRLRMVIEPGPVSAAFNEHIEIRSVDLAVIGSHGRSMIFNIVIGSEAKQLMDEATCDVLVVREPRAAGVL